MSTFHSPIKCTPAWDGNPSWNDLIACSWQHANEGWLVAINYSDHPSQSYVHLPFSDQMHSSLGRQSLVERSHRLFMAACQRRLARRHKLFRSPQPMLCPPSIPRSNALKPGTAIPRGTISSPVHGSMPTKAGSSP